MKLSRLLNRGTGSRRAIAIAGLALIAFALYTAVGVFDTEFGAYGDEGMHYVTGLMVRDFVLAPHRWGHPLEFAKEYYLHFPKVGLGQWPPGFAVLQTIWSIPFGESRHSMLTLMTIMAALLAYIVFRTAAPRHGWLLAFFGAAILLAAPLTQRHAAMVMAEIPLAIASFLAMLAFSRFLSSESWADAVWFGILTSAAILIKGNAWSLVLMTGAALVFTGRLRMIASIRFWAAAAIIGVLCVPLTLLTMRIVQQGMNGPGWLYPASYYLRSLVVHARFAAEIYGYPLTAIALCGVVYGWRTHDVFWRTAAAYAVAVLLFHSFVPTSLEQRKVFQLVPVIALFTVSGLDALARTIPQRLHPRIVACIAGALLFVFSGYTPLNPFTPGFGPVVTRVLSDPSSRRTATLISSNAYFQDCEAGIIAEWMERDRSAETYLVRGTKLLGRISEEDGGTMLYQAVSDDPEQIRHILQSVPIATVILHTMDSKRNYPHHEILRKALELHPEEWERRYEDSRLSTDQHHELVIYQYRRNVQGIPVRLSVDLTRKIGQTVDTGKPTTRQDGP
jgi:hypothetical protein